MVKDQQDPITQLDGTEEGRLAGILANLILQLMLVVGVSAHPVGGLLRQLAQRCVTLQACHKVADWFQPSVGNKPQILKASGCHDALSPWPMD